MMRQRDYLRGKASKTGSKYLRQTFQHLCNKVDYTLKKLKSDYYVPDHVTFLNQVTYSGNLVQTELPF